MKKDVTISFRTSEELRGTLKKVADEDRRSISSLIETIAYDYLRGKKELTAIKDDRRRHPRRNISIPALVQHTDVPGRAYQAGLIMDISPRGVQVSVPRESFAQISAGNKESRFDLIFTLPTSARPLRLQCILRRVIEGAEEFRVGASFMESNTENLNTLQNYLLH